MANFRRFLAVFLLLITASLSVRSEQHLELLMGHKTVRCTYLSPLTYTGPGYGLSYEWRRAAWKEKTVGMQASASFDYGYLLSPVKNSRMLDLAIDLKWGVERLWDFKNGFNVAAGATAGVDGGVIYLPRNGNNPAQALMWVGADLTLRLGYDRLKLLGKPLRISERIDVPSLGCFFCPAYGETYYEIYLGNHNGLAHFGWWGNRPQIKSRLRADWQLGRHALTIGFDYRFQGLECNDITTRIAQCSGILGISF